MRTMNQKIARALWKSLPLWLDLIEVIRELILSDLPLPVSPGFAGYLLVDALKRRMCWWYIGLTVWLGISWALPDIISAAIGITLLVGAWDSWDK